MGETFIWVNSPDIAKTIIMEHHKFKKIEFIPFNWEILK